MHYCSGELLLLLLLLLLMLLLILLMVLMLLLLLLLTWHGLMVHSFELFMLPTIKAENMNTNPIQIKNCRLSESSTEMKIKNAPRLNNKKPRLVHNGQDTELPPENLILGQNI